MVSLFFKPVEFFRDATNVVLKLDGVCSNKAIKLTKKAGYAAENAKLYILCDEKLGLFSEITEESRIFSFSSIILLLLETSLNLRSRFIRLSLSGCFLRNSSTLSLSRSFNSLIFTVSPNFVDNTSVTKNLQKCSLPFSQIALTLEFSIAASQFLHLCFD